MPRSNKQPTKSETNTTGALHKISTKSAKISKSTSEAKRTATDASGKPLRVENVKETKVEAMPQSAKKEANQLHQKPEGKNESTRKEAIYTKKNAITSKTSAAIRGKVKENSAGEKSFRNDNMLRKTGTTATEVSKMHPKPQETAERNGSLAGATGANPESAREPSKCFDDWREFYLQIFGSVKSKSDLIVAFTHYILIKNGFRCLGLGDDRTYAEDEVGSLNLPEGWNHFPKYAIRYIYNRMLHLLLAIHLEHRLLINLLNTRTNVVTNITVYPDITVRATCGAPIDVLIPHPEKLAQSLYYNLIQTFTDAANCFRPPKILSRTSERDNPWKELEARQSQNVNPLDWETSAALGEENQNVQILDADNRQDADSKRDSIISKQFGRRISFNDGNPPTANAKKLKPLKTALAEAVPPVKEAIATYMETMVDNWCRIYGREVMKSGKLAIQDLAEQRKMIEKYIDLAKPVTAPKDDFVIYKTKVSLDDSKQRLMRATFEILESDILSLKTGSKLNQNDLAKLFMEAAHAPRLTQIKSNNKANSLDDKRKEVDEVHEIKQLKNRINYKHIQPKVCTGIRAEKITVKSVPELPANTPAVKIELNGGKSSRGHIEKKIRNAYGVIDTKKPKTKTKRLEGGFNENSIQQNSPDNSETNTKRRRVKLKSTTSGNNNPKIKKRNAIKLLSSTAKRTFYTAEPEVKLSKSSPIKKIRFSLPKPSTTSYLSNNWSNTYESVEKLLNSSFPFRAGEQEREHGGSEQAEEESLTNYNLSNLLTIKPLISPQKKITTETTKRQRKSQRSGGVEKTPQNSTSHLLQKIEEHFADQIEAKRLELLEMVRNRDLQRIIESSDSIQMKNKFIKPKEEVDVGYFVQPADEWSQWEFKKKLMEMHEKRILDTNYKKG